MIRKISAPEHGASDTGVILGLLGIGIVLSIVFGVMSWIEGVKNDRLAAPPEKNKSITDPYHEPGAFTVTF